MTKRKPNSTSWQPGQSGNPAGSAKAESTALRAALAKDGPAVAARMVKAALDGDVQAARLVLERLVPAFRPMAEPVTVTLPDGSLTDQARALLQVAASGTLAPDVAGELLSALARVVTVEQADELRKRLDQLEHGDLA